MQTRQQVYGALNVHGCQLLFAETRIGRGGEMKDDVPRTFQMFGHRTTAQIATNAIKVYVFNSQNNSPDVQAQVDAAKKQGIPITTVTETLSPASAAFQDWQATQLSGLADALHTATGK